MWEPPAIHRPPSGGGAGTPFCPIRGAARPPQPPECHVRGLTEVCMAVGSLGRPPRSLATRTVGSRLPSRPRPMGTARRPRAVTVHSESCRCREASRVPARCMAVGSLGRPPRSLATRTVGSRLPSRPRPMGTARRPRAVTVHSEPCRCREASRVPARCMAVDSLRPGMPPGGGYPPGGAARSAGLVASPRREGYFQWVRWVPVEVQWCSPAGRGTPPWPLVQSPAGQTEADGTRSAGSGRPAC